MAPKGVAGLVLARYSMTDSLPSHSFHAVPCSIVTTISCVGRTTVRPEKRDICWMHSRHLVSRTPDFMRLWKFKSRFPDLLDFIPIPVSARCIENFSYIVAVIYEHTIIVKLGIQLRSSSSNFPSRLRSPWRSSFYI